MLAACASPSGALPGTFSQAAEAILRIHHAGEVDAKFSSRNLAVGEYGEWGAGYERLDDGLAHAFGARAPLASLGVDATVYALDFEDQETDERDSEFIGRVKPLDEHEWDIVARGFARPVADGFAIATNYRRASDLEARANTGGGVAFARTGNDRNIGAYAWARIHALAGTFIGAGTYMQDDRVVVGFPNTDGFSVRFFRIDAADGFEQNELLFSTNAKHLKPIDFYSALRGSDVDPTKSFARNHVFRYIPPPVSARGQGLTGGVAVTRLPSGEDLFRGEAVIYSGRFFAGGSYAAPVDAKNQGTVGAPLGYQFAGGDGLTRQFVRVEPTFDRVTDQAGVRLAVEFMATF
jgi:hypothetical protein